MKTEFHEERERITMLRELLQMSQTEFARKIGISQGALSQIENGRSRLSMETLKSLSVQFNINCNWLVNGKGEIFYNYAESKKSSDKNLIPLIDANARAGYSRGYLNPEYLKALDYYYVPGFEDGGEYRMFEVQGDSMIPTFYSTEIVISKKIEKIKSVKDDTLAVILLPKELKTKRIIQSDSKSFIAKSDNPEFQSVKYKFSDVKELWAIEGKVTKKLQVNALDSERLKQIEKDLHELQTRINRLI